MDYELRIAMAERELAHLKEMQKLEQARLDAHDTSLAAFQARHAQAVEDHDREMKELRAIVMEIGVMLKNFIASMQGETKNGNPSA